MKRTIRIYIGSKTYTGCVIVKAQISAISFTRPPSPTTSPLLTTQERKQKRKKERQNEKKREREMIKRKRKMFSQPAWPTGTHARTPNPTFSLSLSLNRSQSRLVPLYKHARPPRNYPPHNHRLTTPSPFPPPFPRPSTTPPVPPRQCPGSSSLWLIHITSPPPPPPPPRRRTIHPSTHPSSNPHESRRRHESPRDV